MILSTNRMDFVKGLRKLADFLESHEKVRLPSGDLGIYTFGEVESLDLAKRYAKDFGTFERQITENCFKLTKNFSENVSLTAVFYRDNVCERTVVGKKMVKEMVPDPSIDTPLVEVDREVEIVEWSCPESLLT